MRRVRDGDELAFEEIDRRYRQRLTAYAAGFVPADRADDVVQEAFIKASGALAEGEAEIHLRPWLYRIVRNTALNNLRDEPPPHDQLDLEYDGVPQPPDIVSRREEIRELVRSIRALPEQQRDALVQRELEGRSHDEIASSLGVSAGAVRQLIFRARQSVRNGVAALVPLPIPKVLATLFAAGTVATGVAIEESVIQQRPAVPQRAAPVQAISGSPAVSAGLVRRESDGDRHRSAQTREGGDAPARHSVPVRVASQSSVALPIAVPQAPSRAAGTAQGLGSTGGGNHVKLPKHDEGAAPQPSSSTGNGQASGHDKGHGSGKGKGKSKGDG